MIWVPIAPSNTRTRRASSERYRSLISLMRAFFPAMRAATATFCPHSCIFDGDGQSATEVRDHGRDLEHAANGERVARRPGGVAPRRGLRLVAARRVTALRPRAAGPPAQRPCA